MDPITQTLLGAASAHAFFGRRMGGLAAVAGAVAGELPDIDVVIPPLDPALPFELHRHFTHALVAVGAAALITALPFLVVPRWRPLWLGVLGAATVGAATHGLLDTCTTYGTYLLWPFLDRRLSWDLISIIDPIFTAVLVVGLAWALLRRSPVPARVALCVSLAYLGLGVVQHGRASSVQERLARERGHEIVRGRVMPTLGNMIIWRSLYQADGRLWADAVRVPPGSSARVRRGSSVPMALEDDVPEEVRDVVGRFTAFADGYIALVPGERTTLGDMRYSLRPEGFEPLWGIELERADGITQARWVHPSHDRAGAVARLWRDVRTAHDYEDAP